VPRYKFTEDGVQRLEDGAFIPTDPLNPDWIEYQAWLTAGNVPLPADVVVLPDPVLEIDAKTDAAIIAALHPTAGRGEEAGILRDQLAQLLNTLGIDATPDFARLNGIAVAEIEKAQAKKEGLDA